MTWPSPVLAIELLAACQALDLLAPLDTSAALTGVHAAVRRVVPTPRRRSPAAPDIDAISGLIDSGGSSARARCSLA